MSKGLQNRRRMMCETELPDVFKEAYFFCPYSETLSVTDVNNNISPSFNNTSFVEDGLYTSGSGQYVAYNDQKLVNAFSDKKITVFIEFTPFELNRNQYIFDITGGSVGYHFISLFIYKTKNNKFGITLNPTANSQYMDDEVSISPKVIYGSTYKICIRYDYSAKELSFFINGGSQKYYNYNQTGYLRGVYISKNSGRSGRDAKAIVKKFALWNKSLSDEDCLMLSI